MLGARVRSSGRAESWRQVCSKGLLVFERAARLAHGGQPPTGAPRPLGQQSGSAAGVRAPAATRPDTHESSADPRPLLLGARDPEPSPGVENRCARGLRSPSPFSTAHSVSLLPPPRRVFLLPPPRSTVEGALSKKKQKKSHPAGGRLIKTDEASPHGSPVPTPYPPLSWQVMAYTRPSRRPSGCTGPSVCSCPARTPPLPAVPARAPVHRVQVCGLSSGPIPVRRTLQLLMSVIRARTRAHTHTCSHSGIARNARSAFGHNYGV